MISLDAFRDRAGRLLGQFRQSAVLLLVQSGNDEDYLILERRAMTLRSQPGDISFPGGRLEGAETPREAALRETLEEIGVPPQAIEVMGTLGYYVTHYGAVIHPFVARTQMDDFIPNPDEVAEIIRVPLRYLLEQEPEIYPLHIDPSPPEDFPFDRIVGGRDYPFSRILVEEYFYHWQGIHIWGTTARILHEFLMILKADLNASEATGEQRPPGGNNNRETS